MANVNTKELVIQEKIGTWSQSRKLLMECENNHNNGYAMKYSKNLKNVYKLMRWLEESNKIENHAIEKDSKIYIPQGLCDYIKIIGTEIPLSKDCEYTQEDFEIKYEDTPVFQHRRQPKLDSDVSTMHVLDSLSKDLFYDEKKIKWAPLAEDFKSEDMSVEEIVSQNPCLEDKFREILHFKNVIKEEAEQNNKNIILLQDRIDSLLKNIVEEAKIDMLDLMKLCSIKEWQSLAVKLYDRFCSDNSSDLKDDELLNRLFTEHKKTVKCINDFKQRFIEYIKRYNYDINGLDIEEFHSSIYGKYEDDRENEKGISRPIFGNFPKLKKSISKENLSELKKIPEYLEAIKGPAICFHDIQGFNVSAKEIQIKNRRFSCKLIFNFYDHFGLDSKDIDKFGDNSLVGRGFQGWYILQHLYEYKTGCKAFVTHATHEEPVEVEIEE